MVAKALPVLKFRLLKLPKKYGIRNPGQKVVALAAAMLARAPIAFTIMRIEVSWNLQTRTRKGNVRNWFAMAPRLPTTFALENSVGPTSNMSLRYPKVRAPSLSVA